MPQRGMDKSCSLYRGTCIGSVEKRIRGIVPPNADIVGQTAYGGLRYCKEKTIFSSVQHYYTDDDIMQAGQTCLEGKTPTYEGWDWSRQHDNPKTVRDRFGLACADPDDEATCPKSRECMDGKGCITDTPDWLSIDALISRWGLAKLKQFADNSLTCNTYGTHGLSPVDAAATGQVSIPCTFEKHKIILTPSTAGSEANWPFLQPSFLDAYSQVTWSVESQARTPSPSPPPNFVFIG